MLKVLFIGDINGKIGRKTVAKVLPKIKKEYHPDIVIANAENSAHGAGITEDALKELMDAGVDFFTAGDHAFDRTKQTAVYEKCPLIRPANFSADCPGNGFYLIKSGGHSVLLVNLIGRVFMRMDHDCPFNKLNEILANFDLPKKKLSAIIVDIHAEATSEKIALKHYFDGKITALLGTHTHIPTADEEITENGTAYITDVGMVGAKNGCLGVDKDNIIKTFLTQIKYQHTIPEKGEAVFNAVFVAINEKTGKAKSIKRIEKTVNIK